MGKRTGEAVSYFTIRISTLMEEERLGSFLAVRRVWPFIDLPLLEDSEH